MIKYPKPTKKKTVKKKKPKQITKSKVQDAFNRMMREDKPYCQVCSLDNCTGSLQCSHFFPKSTCSNLRFVPENVKTQSASCHVRHHQVDPLFYPKHMMEHYPEDLEYLEEARKVKFRYTQEILRTVLEFCKNYDVEGLSDYWKKFFNETKGL